MALRQRLEQTGLPFTSADALIEAALDVQHEEFAAQDIRQVHFYSVIIGNGFCTFWIFLS